tara:strand:- start:396 stop:701 length:306 start_codon:yes stop_codon:yes gene_type:complete
MHGNLDPDERILEPETFDVKMLKNLYKIIEDLGWEDTDEIDVEIGGTQVSGIDVGEEYNKKWQSPFGTRKYNKDAFIIIKNQNRRDLSKSLPMEEFNPQHK